jgi:hypothetical protein
MSYTEARSHFEKAKLDNSNKGMLDLLDGLKHLSHALEEDFRTSIYPTLSKRTSEP